MVGVPGTEFRCVAAQAVPLVPTCPPLVPYPDSWNKYAYTRGDPVNRFDRHGTCDQSGDTDTSVTVCGDSDPDSTVDYVYAVPDIDFDQVTEQQIQDANNGIAALMNSLSQTVAGFICLLRHNSAGSSSVKRPTRNTRKRKRSLFDRP
jgi:hypothetical protein